MSLEKDIRKLNRRIQKRAEKIDRLLKEFAGENYKDLIKDEQKLVIPNYDPNVQPIVWNNPPVYPSQVVIQPTTLVHQPRQQTQTTTPKINPLRVKR